MHTYIPTPSQQLSTNTTRNKTKKTTKKKMHVHLHPHARTRHNNTTNTSNTQNRQQTQQHIYVIHTYIYKPEPGPETKQKKERKTTQRIQYAGTFPQILSRYRASHQELPGQTGNKTNAYYYTFLTVPAPVELISFCAPVPKKQKHPQNHSAPAPSIYISLYTGT